MLVLIQTARVDRQGAIAPGAIWPGWLALLLTTIVTLSACASRCACREAITIDSAPALTAAPAPADGGDLDLALAPLAAPEPPRANLPPEFDAILETGGPRANLSGVPVDAVPVAASISLADEHCPFGGPRWTGQGRAGRVITRRGYVLFHDSERRVADWVEYHLTEEYVRGEGELRATARALEAVKSDKARLINENDKLAAESIAIRSQLAARIQEMGELRIKITEAEHRRD